ncbi:MAG: DNA adenine methylase [Campylobacteraceae bacterium]
MNYLGSKKTLTTFIIENIEKQTCLPISSLVICDAFGGVGEVSKALLLKGVKLLHVNDIESYSHVLLKQFLNGVNSKRYIDLTFELNSEIPKDFGLISEHFSPFGKEKRAYFTIKNAQKIDFIRQNIEEKLERKEIFEDEYNALLASLIFASDKVANTISMYGAYLKEFKFTAKQDLLLEPIKTLQGEVIHHNLDANVLIKKISGDVLYLDPPYNHRQYGLNYHLLNTIVNYKEFTPKGKSGFGEYIRSSWASKKHVLRVFEEMIKNANFKWVFLSYNNEGLMSEVDIQKIMQKYGKYERVFTLKDKLRMQKVKKSTTKEFLHVLKKD